MTVNQEVLGNITIKSGSGGTLANLTQIGGDLKLHTLQIENSKIPELIWSLKILHKTQKQASNESTKTN